VTDLAIGLDATVGADPADPATAILNGDVPPGFVDALDSTALSGARLGALTDLFGDSQEDREAGSVIRGALEKMKELGAEIIDIEIPGLDTLLRSTSVITYEFKFDLIDYLAANPGAPLESMQDILDQGLYHEALEQRFQSRNRVERRDTEAYRRALAKRDSVRSALLAALETDRLDAIVYPTLRRKAARIGDPQLGSNCQLSAASELPALSMPAGFTEDGIPIGMELMGRPLSDAQLLAYAFSYEQAYRPRRPPPFVPQLVDGRAPDPLTFSTRMETATTDVSGSFLFDVTTGVFAYDVVVSGIPADSVFAIVISRRVEDGSSAVARSLSGPGAARTAGTIDLPFAIRTALASDRLYLQVFTSTGVVNVEFEVGG